jgi:hypothetical protein
MENKQTAVEWLAGQFDSIVELYPSQFEKINNAIEQAKQMEKQQIMDAHYAPKYGCFNEEYYNETYGGNNGE